MPSFARWALAGAVIAAALWSLPSQAQAEGKKPLTLESIYAGDAFDVAGIENIAWRADGSSFTYTRRDPETGRRAIFRQSVETGETERLLASGALRYDGRPVRITGYQWADGRAFLLLRGEQRRRWDNSLDAPYYVYEMETGELSALAEADAGIRSVAAAPEGPRVAYVRGNDIYIANLRSGGTRRVTEDGGPNTLNGRLDYVTRQALRISKGLVWSPDGRELAFWRTDTAEVKTYYMLDQLGDYPELHELKYPVVGEKNARFRIGVYSLGADETTWMEIGEEPGRLIPRLVWTGREGLLAIQRLNRGHDKLATLLGDTATGQTRVVTADTDPAWVDVTDDLLFLERSERFVWTSEKSGYRHAYLSAFDGGEIRQLTRGDWAISELIGLDEAGGWLYFTAKKDSLIDQHVYRVRLDGSRLEKLTEKPGWHTWRLSPNGKRVIATHSDIHTPPRTRLLTSAGKTVRTLKANTLAGLETYRLPRPEFLKVETSDGVRLNAVMIKPPDFDPNRQYPVIAYGYGNPGSQVVVNRWGDSRKRWLWHRYMAEQGYIVFALDNRTTAGRGKRAKNMTHGHYAKYAIRDQIEGANYLSRLDYVDAERIGFWGWSGGGYLAAALMTKGAPHFDVGVSIAPVIDLSRYQSIGVERWMGTPQTNPEGYRATNLLNFAHRLEGDLLLVHGTGDENVKHAFTLQFADALIAENKAFDMMLYPGRHHGIRDARLHLFSTLTAYFEATL